jgi:acetyltransferase-like isoleucine patch superfamily enzyme
MNWLLKLAARTLWIYSYITLALVLAMSAFPAVLMVASVWDAAWHTGWPDAATWFVRTFAVALGYIIFGITMMILFPILAKILGWKTGEGTVPIRSFKVWNWYNYNGAILTFQTLFGKFTRANALYVVFLRAMGAKIGRNVIINSNCIYDHDILEIGDNTVIGGDAAIIGHVGEHGNLVRKKIIIGKNCTIGQYTTVFPGAVIGDNCHVGAMSLVPKDMQLYSNAVYGGVPARKIKNLPPFEQGTVGLIQSADLAGSLPTDPAGLGAEFSKHTNE